MLLHSLLSSGSYDVIDRVNHRIITIDSAYPKVAVGYTPSVGSVVVNLKRLSRGLAEKRYRLKYLGA